MNKNLSVIILAAGKGTRMYSALPKVLHKLAGSSLLEHVYLTTQDISHRDVYVVYGYGGEAVREQCRDLFVNWIEQKEQLGTGHAVQQAMPDVPDGDNVLILYGDVPLITASSLNRLVQAGEETGFGLLTVELDNPTGYGRIVRNGEGDVIKIVEQKDASDDELTITEVNTGMMLIQAKSLKQWLSDLKSDNAQSEYYLTDVIEMAVAEGIKIQAVQPDSPVEANGINTRTQLAEMERYYQFIQSHHLMKSGVTIIDPARFDLRGELEVGQDVCIDINVILEAKVSLGNNVMIGANCIIKNSMIGDEVEILPNTIIEDAEIGVQSRIGPFARIRPETKLSEKVHVGNFVEIKKSFVERGSKINHLSYVGDSEIGLNVNIGAGTITCNYDGANKYKTIIGDNVFVGSDTQLVAPVKVGSGATIAAGTTVTQDVEATDLVISRVPQKTISGWKRPEKNNKK